MRLLNRFHHWIPFLIVAVPMLWGFDPYRAGWTSSALAWALVMEIVRGDTEEDIQRITQGCKQVSEVLERVGAYMEAHRPSFEEVFLGVAAFALAAITLLCRYSHYGLLWTLFMGSSLWQAVSRSVRNRA